MFVPLLSGLAAGSVHVVTGPDHLAAVAPLAAHDPAAAARTGAAWGFGHGLGVVILGGVGMAAREFVDIHALSGWSEFAVGFLLVGLGVWGVRAGLGMKVHSHDHEHVEGDDHTHPHVHLPGEEHGPAAHQGHTHAAFGVGMFHGAAGMGHLLGVVPALALPPAQSAVYLAAYLLAAVLSMSLFGLALGGVARRLGGALRGMVVATGVFSVVVGGVWLATTWPGAT